MGKSLTLGTILAALVMFIWMFISWMVLPWHCATMGKFTHEESVASVILSNTTSSGIYVLPNCHEKKDQADGYAAWKKGPVVFSSIMREGRDFTSPKPYILSFILQLVSSLIVTWMVLKAKLLEYGERLGFVVLFGIAAGLLATIPDWNWWGFSLSYTLVAFFDFVIAWFLAGLVIAAVTKPEVATR